MRLMSLRRTTMELTTLKPTILNSHKELITKVVAEMRKARLPEKDVQAAVRKYWQEVKA